MDEEINVYGDIDELTLEELYVLQKRLFDDIEFIKMKENKDHLDSEVDRLKYVNELIKKRERKKSGMNKNYELLGKQELKDLTKEELLEAKAVFEKARDSALENAKDSDYKGSTEAYEDKKYEEERIAIVDELLKTK